MSLQTIKIVHTMIWGIMTTANFIAFTYAYLGVFDYRFWIPALIICGEILVILFNKWKCPVTTVAEKYTDDRRANFDIYLPLWLATYNKEVFTVIIVVEIMLVVVRHGV